MDLKVSWQKLSWKEIEEVLPKVEVVLIPTGAVEQHGPHLATEHDSRSAIVVCEEAARRLYPRVLVAPSFFLGFSPHNLSRRLPGTFTLRAETFIELMLDIFTSLQRFDVEKAVVVNGHGGNVQPLTVAARRAREELDILVATLSYWDLIQKEELARILERGPLRVAHAGEFETSFALACFPENVRRDLIPEAQSDFAERDGEYLRLHLPLYSDEWLDHGCTDEPEYASMEKGKELFELAVSGLVKYVWEFTKFKPKHGWHKPF
jgi:creatinine amidohydrolase